MKITLAAILASSAILYNDLMEMSVGDLQVIAYVPVNCPKHTYKLMVMPVDQCAFYLSAKNCDRKAYDAYVALTVKRDNRMVPSYETFQKQVNEIRLDGGYRADKVGDQPMMIYQGTKWLKDGHHRAAIICAIFGPDTKVSAEVADVDLPDDINKCLNPCPS